MLTVNERRLYRHKLPKKGKTRSICFAMASIPPFACQWYYERRNEKENDGASKAALNADGQ